MLKKTISAALFISLLSVGCKVNQKNEQQAAELKIGFYNVENLFDTINDPQINDEDFTPEGKLKWNSAHYTEKLDRLAQVFSEMAAGGIDAAGLCEVENKQVVLDLVHQQRLSGKDLQIVHFDSPDERGIDVAFIYDAKKMSVIRSRRFELELPENDRTRDILYVVAKAEGEELHFFVNHWPSRSGGQAESEPSRMKAAALLRSKIDSIQSVEKEAKILCMGDFNDYPMDKSIAGVLGAGGSDSFLFDYMLDDQQRNEGSHWYKGEWGPLDQFIATKSVVTGSKGWTASPEQASIVRLDYLFFKDNEGKLRPSRSYAGDSYKGGYSDHLPIVIQLKKVK